MQAVPHAERMGTGSSARWRLSAAWKASMTARCQRRSPRWRIHSTAVPTVSRTSSTCFANAVRLAAPARPRCAPAARGRGALRRCQQAAFARHGSCARCYFRSSDL